MPFEQRMEEGLSVPLARIAIRPPVAALGGHAGEQSLTHKMPRVGAESKVQSNAIRKGVLERTGHATSTTARVMMRNEREREIRKPAWARGARERARCGQELRPSGC